MKRQRYAAEVTFHRDSYLWSAFSSRKKLVDRWFRGGEYHESSGRVMSCHAGGDMHASLGAYREGGVGY